MMNPTFDVISLLRRMSAIPTIDGYGECVEVAAAKRIIFAYGVTTRLDKGALVFRYPWEVETRRVNPIFVNGRGWMCLLREVRPE